MFWLFPHSGNYVNTRLVSLSNNASQDTEGRVEVNYQGQWGTVCGNNWDENDATVVCNQLGYSGPSSANVGVYGRGLGTVWLNNVRCTGREGSLASCNHDGWGDHTDTCRAGAAGVICSNATEIGNASNFLYFASKRRKPRQVTSVRLPYQKVGLYMQILFSRTF